MTSKRSLQPLAACFPVGIGRLLVLPLAALLLMQNLPLGTPAAPCCTPQHCHCAKGMCDCPNCPKHHGGQHSRSQNDGPTFQPCTGAMGATLLPTLTLPKSLTSGKPFLQFFHADERALSPATPLSSQREGADIFHPPRPRLG